MVAVVPTHEISSPRQRKSRRSQKKKKSVSRPSAEQGDVDNDPMGDDLLPTDTTARTPSQPDGQTASGNQYGDDEVVMIDPSASEATTSLPAFPPLPASAHTSSSKSETRRIPIPPHRMTPLQKDWINIFSPLTEMCGLQVRMNVFRKSVEMRVRMVSKRCRSSVILSCFRKN